MSDAPDLVVAGAGGGLAGALRAAQFGLSVVVVEASEHFARGNNTAMSTAMVPGAGTRWQRGSGVDDSPDRFVADILRKTGGQADRGLARALAGVSARLVEWLADDVGLAVDLVTDFSYPGHSRPRCHTIPGRSGKRLVAALRGAVARNDEVDLLCPARLVDVRADPDVSGITVEYPDGRREEIPCRAVLLATNGFGANPDLVRQHLPEIAGAVYHGSPESRGDALRIGCAVGAHAAFLDAYQGHAALAVPGATLAGWATVMHGGFLVNASGRRFGDETEGYSEYARRVLAQPGSSAALVFDRRIHDACRRFDDFRDTVESGALRWADDPRRLAADLDVDPDGLSGTIEHVTGVARGREADPFGRDAWEAPLAAPFAGVRVVPALFHTQGGLCVDGHAQVLRPDRGPIRGLYASGGAATGISGHGASGYLAGNGLLPALGLAFLAAEQVARDDAGRQE
ncbi:MAG: FAD-dependent oxidoreductase [Streptosporangiaceae bacterium]